jgi:hypothetical protein
MIGSDRLCSTLDEVRVRLTMSTCVRQPAQVSL